MLLPLMIMLAADGRPTLYGCGKKNVAAAARGSGGGNGAACCLLLLPLFYLFGGANLHF